jgi:diguanylate cyclase (GGDEF)-like protein/PAS domain S-box-containing protein
MIFRHTVNLLARALVSFSNETPDIESTSAPVDTIHNDFRLLADYSLDLICRAQPGGVLSYVSPSSFRLLGWTPEEILGRNFREFIYPEDFAIAGPLIAKLIAREVEEVTSTCRAVRKDGSVFWAEANARTVWDPKTGERAFTVFILRDITDHKQLETHLAELAFRDGLTGLTNRRGFDEALDREWRRHFRERYPLSLLLLDVDRFKAFNDQYGNQVGDDCLRAVALAVEQAVRRPGDQVARYGGEEIAVILPQTDAVGALVVAENVRAAVAELYIHHAGNAACGGRVTVSVGVATGLPSNGGARRMPEALIAAADTALYKAKDGGRNRVETAFVASKDVPYAKQVLAL